MLGAEGGTYYATEKKLARDNAACVERLIQLDGVRLVREVADLSESGRAPKNDPAIFALAMAAKLGDLTRRARLRTRPCRASAASARTSTTSRSSPARSAAVVGARGMRRALGRWFNTRAVDDAGSSSS